MNLYDGRFCTMERAIKDVVHMVQEVQPPDVIQRLEIIASQMPRGAVRKAVHTILKKYGYASEEGRRATFLGLMIRM